MAEPEATDGYFEIQLDRETVALAALGFVVLLVLAFLLGRWTAAPAPDAPDATELASSEEGPGEPSARVEEELVDGEPLFGRSPVSARDAPPVSPVPEPPVGEVPPPGPAVGSSAAGTRPPAPEAAATGSPAALPAPADSGWFVQVAALRVEAEAAALRRRLAGKGYPVRVVVEDGFHKVRVGPYARRSDAQVVERRLKREERLGTWLMRP